MFRALITSIPFQRIPSLANPEWNHIPRTILHDITQFIHIERLFYPNKQPLYNNKPFIYIAQNAQQYIMDSVSLPNQPEYKPLSRKYCNSYLIDTFSRDLSVYNNQDNKILVSRHWVDYNQHSKLLHILSVLEIFDYHVKFTAYMQYLHGTRCIPDFNAKTHTQFLANLQEID